MVSKENEYCQYGIFTKNELLCSVGKPQQQNTVLLGQIVRIENILSDGSLVVRLKASESWNWEPDHFICSSTNVVSIHEKLWQYIASIGSPQERVKLAKNTKLCDHLKNITKGMTVGFTDSKDIYLGTVRYIGRVKGMDYSYGIELHVS